MSEMFNKQFGSVFSAPTNTSPDKTLTNIYPEMSPITVTIKGVHNLLTNINPNKATGPDGIPGRVLKELADYFAPIYTILFQASLNQGSVQFRMIGNRHI